MVRRSEVPLPHAISSWGGGAAVVVLHCQKGPQASQHVPAQSGVTILHPTQEQVELRRGGVFSRAVAGGLALGQATPRSTGWLMVPEGLCAGTPYTLFFKNLHFQKKPSVGFA